MFGKPQPKDDFLKKKFQEVQKTPENKKFTKKAGSLLGILLTLSRFFPASVVTALGGPTPAGLVVAALGAVGIGAPTAYFATKGVSGSSARGKKKGEKSFQKVFGSSKGPVGSVVSEEDQRAQNLEDQEAYPDEESSLGLMIPDEALGVKADKAGKSDGLDKIGKSSSKDIDIEFSGSSSKSRSRLSSGGGGLGGGLGGFGGGGGSGGGGGYAPAGGKQAGVASPLGRGRGEGKAGGSTGGATGRSSKTAITAGKRLQLPGGGKGLIGLQKKAETVIAQCKEAQSADRNAACGGVAFSESPKGFSEIKKGPGAAAGSVVDGLTTQPTLAQAPPPSQMGPIGKGGGAPSACADDKKKEFQDRMDKAIQQKPGEDGNTEQASKIIAESQAAGCGAMDEKTTTWPTSFTLGAVGILGVFATGILLVPLVKNAPLDFGGIMARAGVAAGIILSALYALDKITSCMDDPDAAFTIGAAMIMTTIAGNILGGIFGGLGSMIMSGIGTVLGGIAGGAVTDGGFKIKRPDFLKNIGGNNCDGKTLNGTGNTIGMGMMGLLSWATADSMMGVFGGHSVLADNIGTGLLGLGKAAEAAPTPSSAKAAVQADNDVARAEQIEKDAKEMTVEDFEKKHPDVMIDDKGRPVDRGYRYAADGSLEEGSAPRAIVGKDGKAAVGDDALAKAAVRDKDDMNLVDITAGNKDIKGTEAPIKAEDIEPTLEPLKDAQGKPILPDDAPVASTGASNAASRAVKNAAQAAAAPTSSADTAVTSEASKAAAIDTANTEPELTPLKDATGNAILPEKPAAADTASGAAKNVAKEAVAPSGAPPTPATPAAAAPGVPAPETTGSGPTQGDAHNAVVERSRADLRETVDNRDWQGVKPAQREIDLENARHDVETGKMTSQDFEKKFSNYKVDVVEHEGQKYANIEMKQEVSPISSAPTDSSTTAASGTSATPAATEASGAGQPTTGAGGEGRRIVSQTEYDKIQGESIAQREQAQTEEAWKKYADARTSGGEVPKEEVERLNQAYKQEKFESLQAQSEAQHAEVAHLREQGKINEAYKLENEASRTEARMNEFAPPKPTITPSAPEPSAPGSTPQDQLDAVNALRAQRGADPLQSLNDPVSSPEYKVANTDDLGKAVTEGRMSASEADLTKDFRETMTNNQLSDAEKTQVQQEFLQQRNTIRSQEGFAGGGDLGPAAPTAPGASAAPATPSAEAAVPASAAPASSQVEPALEPLEPSGPTAKVRHETAMNRSMEDLKVARASGDQAAVDAATQEIKLEGARYQVEQGDMSLGDFKQKFSEYTIDNRGDMEMKPEIPGGAGPAAPGVSAADHATTGAHKAAALDAAKDPTGPVFNVENKAPAGAKKLMVDDNNTAWYENPKYDPAHPNPNQPRYVVVPDEGVKLDQFGQPLSSESPGLQAARGTDNFGRQAGDVGHGTEFSPEQIQAAEQKLGRPITHEDIVHPKGEIGKAMYSGRQKANIDQLRQAQIEGVSINDPDEIGKQLKNIPGSGGKATIHNIAEDGTVTYRLPDGSTGMMNEPTLSQTPPSEPALAELIPKTPPGQVSGVEPQSLKDALSPGNLQSDPTLASGSPGPTDLKLTTPELGAPEPPPPSLHPGKLNMDLSMDDQPGVAPAAPAGSAPELELEPLKIETPVAAPNQDMSGLHGTERVHAVADGRGGFGVPEPPTGSVTPAQAVPAPSEAIPAPTPEPRLDRIVAPGPTEQLAGESTVAGHVQERLPQGAKDVYYVSDAEGHDTGEIHYKDAKDQDVWVKESQLPKTQAEIAGSQADDFAHNMGQRIAGQEPTPPSGLGSLSLPGEPGYQDPSSIGATPAQTTPAPAAAPQGPTPYDLASPPEPPLETPRTFNDPKVVSAHAENTPSGEFGVTTPSQGAATQASAPGAPDAGGGSGIGTTEPPPVRRLVSQEEFNDINNSEINQNVGEKLHEAKIKGLGERWQQAQGNPEAIEQVRKDFGRESLRYANDTGQDINLNRPLQDFTSDPVIGSHRDAQGNILGTGTVPSQSIDIGPNEAGNGRLFSAPDESVYSVSNAQIQQAGPALEPLVPAAPMTPQSQDFQGGNPFTHDLPPLDNAGAPRPIPEPELQLEPLDPTPKPPSALPPGEKEYGGAIIDLDATPRVEAGSTFTSHVDPATGKTIYRATMEPMEHPPIEPLEPPKIVTYDNPVEAVAPLAGPSGDVHKADIEAAGAIQEHKATVQIAKEAGDTQGVHEAHQTLIQKLAARNVAKGSLSIEGFEQKYPGLTVDKGTGQIILKLASLPNGDAIADILK